MYLVVELSLAPELEPLAKLLGERKLSVAVAESCTAGLLGACLADLPGASGYFLGGFITYATDTKASQLGVPDEVLSREGAVSAEVAGAMAGARSRSTTSRAGGPPTGCSRWRRPSPWLAGCWKTPVAASRGRRRA